MRAAILSPALETSDKLDLMIYKKFRVSEKIFKLVVEAETLEEIELLNQTDFFLLHGVRYGSQWSKQLQPGLPRKKAKKEPSKKPSGRGLLP